VGTLSPQLAVPSKILLERLSYSHIELLVDMDDDAKRAFYEAECIQGNWSVRELNRQISSLYYERTGLTAGDNPPIGMLLCTDNNNALVEYALAGMANNLFVSKYLLELPKKDDMQAFLEEQVKDIADQEGNH
jgi:hypothetical protein